jgi:hypothetical protein
MVENTHYQQIGKFVVLFQGLESSLIGMIGAITDEDYAAPILPAETKYRRLIGATDVNFSHIVDRLHQPDLEAKARFHELMEKCLHIGALRDRLIHSKYALLISADDVGAPAQINGKLKLKEGSRGQVSGEDPAPESFELFCRQIAEVVAELESFRLQVIEWKRCDT